MTSAGEGSFGSLVDWINQKGVVQTNDYLVQAQATPDMTVKVTPGTAYLPSIAAVPPSINATIYSSILDANLNVTIAANSSGVAKTDAVVLYIDTAASADATASNVAKLTSVRGASGAPTDGEIATAVGASNPFLRLAEVAVANGATSINSGNITDKRQYAGLTAASLTPSAITLGYAQITTNATNTATTPTTVAGLSIAVTIPSGSRRIKITFFTYKLANDGGGGATSQTSVTVWDGTVGSGTQLASATYDLITGTKGVPVTCIAVVQPAAGAKTYNIGLSSNTTGATNTISAAVNSPAFILVEAI